MSVPNTALSLHGSINQWSNSLSAKDKGQVGGVTSTVGLQSSAQIGPFQSIP